MKIKLGTQVGLVPGHIALDGDPPLPPQRGTAAPILGRYVLRPNVSMGQLSLGMELGLGPGDFVLDGDPATPSSKGGENPKLSVHVYCGQTAGWIKMHLARRLASSQATLC